MNTNEHEPRMNTNKHEPLMNTNKHELKYEKEVYEIVSCAMEVLNVLGHGLLEKPYENALAVEFNLRNIPFIQQKHFPVIYKNVQVGEYAPDFIVYDKIIVEIKAVEIISNIEMGQVINYLKITGLQLGLILNFKKPKLEWKRIVL